MRAYSVVVGVVQLLRIRDALDSITAVDIASLRDSVGHLGETVS